MKVWLFRINVQAILPSASYTLDNLHKGKPSHRFLFTTKIQKFCKAKTIFCQIKMKCSSRLDHNVKRREIVIFHSGGEKRISAGVHRMKNDFFSI